MKSLIILSFSFLSFIVNAQDCSTSLLFKKGTLLDYKTYAPRMTGGFKMEYYETTRLSYVVVSVKDSNSITYSYITKTGANPNDETMRYEKNYVVSCDGKTISMPSDFYGMDTIYFNNIYPKSKDKGYYQATVSQERSILSFPLDLEKGKFTISNNRSKSTTKMRDYPRGLDNSKFSSMNVGGITESKFDVTSIINSIETKEKEKVATSGVSYDCYKIIFMTNMELGNRNMDANIASYYTSAVGLVKSDYLKSKNKNGIIELVKVTP